MAYEYVVISKAVRAWAVSLDVFQTWHRVELGIPGLQYRVSPNGQQYKSFSIPGTGLYWIKYFKQARASSPPPAGLAFPPLYAPAANPPSSAPTPGRKAP